MLTKMLQSLVGRNVQSRKGATTTEGRLHKFAHHYTVIGETSRMNFSAGEVVTIIRDNTNRTIEIVLGKEK